MLFVPSGIARAHIAQIKVVCDTGINLNISAKNSGITTSLAVERAYILTSLNVFFRSIAETVIPVSSIATGDIQLPETVIASRRKAGTGI